MRLLVGATAFFTADSCLAAAVEPGFLQERQLLIAQQQQPSQRFMQGQPALPPMPKDQGDPLILQERTSPSSPSSPADPGAAKLTLKQIRIEGNTVLRGDELMSIVTPLIGSSLSIGELRAAADRMTQKYVEAGYLTTRAVLGDQDVRDGVVVIQVIEGRLQPNGITVNGAFRLQNYVRSRVARGLQTPLRVDRIEDQLILLRDDPLIDSIKARLLPGKRLGESLIEVDVIEADPLSTSLTADNFSPPILGAERYGGSLAYGNLTGLGDGIDVSYLHTSKTNSLWDLRYRVPLNPMNGTLEARAFLSRSEITSNQSFGAITQGELRPESFNLTLKSDYDFYQASFRQPLWRTPRQEFAITSGFNYRKGFPLEALEATGLPDVLATFVSEQGLQPGLQQLGLLSPDLNQDTTSVLQLGADYLARDRGGFWYLRSQFNLGTGLFGATVRPRPLPDSQFFSWLLQAQRIQKLWVDNSLILSADLQLSADPLLASEQFVIGGALSVRGYQQNIRFGDNGYRVSAEHRIPILKASSGRPTLQLAPFVDAGQVWNHPTNPIPLPSQTFLIGIGAGIIWTPLPQIAVRLDAAPPLINLQDRGTNMQDNGLYFSVSITPQ